MTEIRANSKNESFLNRETSLFKAGVVFFIVMVVTWAVLFAIGQKYFWQSSQAQTPHERGLSYYQALADKDPTKPEHWVDLGWYYSQSGDYDLALENHNKALALDPEHFGALYNVGVTYLQMSDYNSAVESLEKATIGSPKNWEAHMVLGMAYMGQEKWSEAEEALGVALDINRHSSDTHFYMGYLYEKTNRMNDAREYYEEALRYNPDHLAAREGHDRVSDNS
jgi:tetratricopeptide (TPR) repeat protein